jgi:hypothetical protein
MGVGQTPAFVSSRRRSVRNWNKENGRSGPRPPINSFIPFVYAVKAGKLGLYTAGEKSTLSSVGITPDQKDFACFSRMKCKVLSNVKTLFFRINHCLFEAAAQSLARAHGVRE